jgi:hypothetical protein
MIDKIQIKLEEIRKQKEQVVANFHTLNGAEQVLLQLISELETQVEEEAE